MSKLEAFKKRFEQRVRQCVPESAKESGGKQNTEVKAVVLGIVDRGQGRPPTIVCFLHDLDNAKLGENTVLAEDSQSIRVTPKKASPVKDVVDVASHTVIEVSDYTQPRSKLAFGDAVWLVNLTIYRNEKRSHFTSSFVRFDYSTDAYSKLTSAGHRMFYVPPYNPNEWTNVLVPVGPLPQDEADIQTPGVYGEIAKIWDTTYGDDQKTHLNFHVDVRQWMTNIETDGVCVQLPGLRLWYNHVRAFGFTNTDAWNGIARTILPHTHFYIRGYVHKETTERKIQTLTPSDNEHTLCVRVQQVILDKQNFLDTVGIPIHFSHAQELLQKRVESVDNEWNVDGSRFWNASECTREFNDTDTQFYAVTNLDVSGVQCTPEEGSRRLRQEAKEDTILIVFAVLPISRKRPREDRS